MGPWWRVLGVLSATMPTSGVLMRCVLEHGRRRMGDRHRLDIHGLMLAIRTGRSLRGSPR